MANLAQMVNVIAPIMTNDTGVFLQPIYFPIVEFGKQRGNTSLDAWVSSPTYKVPGRPQDVPYLDVSSTYDPAQKLIYVNVLNRSKERDITATLETAVRVDPSAAVWQMNHADLKATHTFGNDRTVRPATSTATLQWNQGAASYTFPAHSLTIVRLKATDARSE
jgi:alpha-N-arabinofuranosidase